MWRLSADVAQCVLKRNLQYLDGNSDRVVDLSHNGLHSHFYGPEGNHGRNYRGLTQPDGLLRVHSDDPAIKRRAPVFMIIGGRSPRGIRRGHLRAFRVSAGIDIPGTGPSFRAWAEGCSPFRPRVYY